MALGRLCMARWHRCPCAVAHSSAVRNKPSQRRGKLQWNKRKESTGQPARGALPQSLPYLNNTSSTACALLREVIPASVLAAGAPWSRTVVCSNSC